MHRHAEEEDARLQQHPAVVSSQMVDPLSTIWDSSLKMGEYVSFT